MGNRFVDNVVILSTVLLRITNLYCVLIDNEHNTAKDKSTQCWSVATEFSADNEATWVIHSIALTTCWILIE